MYMRTIEGKTFGEERALYAQKNLKLSDCRIAGPEDGESALKECSGIEAENCLFDLRYPLWHGNGVRLRGCTQTENCRAALWYCKDVNVTESRLNGIKAVRECRRVTLKDDEINSPEFGWRSRGIKISNCTVNSQYAFFEAEDLEADGLELEGKYTFQYVRNAVFRNCRFKTKDAFWHSENVTVYDSLVEGEYLGWYSRGLKLVRCRIKGTQPLCYCKNLILEDCTAEGCDLTFEYSDVNATIKGGILSVKNPRSGTIRADDIGSVIITPDSKAKPRAKIYRGGKRVRP